MAIRFTAEEVLQVSLQIERNGARFYRFAAELKADARTRETLLDLAAMEDRHYDLFAAMRAQLPPQAREETAFDPDQELPLYLRALADRRVFDVSRDPTEQLTGRESIAQMLEYALGMEKDSVVFYLGMKDLVPPEVGQAHIEGIIREEMTHLSILGGRLRAVTEAGE